MRGNNNYTCGAERGIVLPSIAAKGSTGIQTQECTRPSDKSHRGGNQTQKVKLPTIKDAEGKMEATGSNTDLRVIVYESMEQMRASKIGVKPLQGFDVTRAKKAEALNKHRRSLPPMSATPVAPQLQPLQAQNEAPGGLTRSNSIAPFTTLAPKPTCGYYFNRETINKKVRIGVPPSDLVKWRSDYTQYAQKQA